MVYTCYIFLFHFFLSFFENTTSWRVFICSLLLKTLLNSCNVCTGILKFIYFHPYDMWSEKKYKYFSQREIKCQYIIKNKISLLLCRNRQHTC